MVGVGRGMLWMLKRVSQGYILGVVQVFSFSWAVIFSLSLLFFFFLAVFFCFFHFYLFAPLSIYIR